MADHLLKLDLSAKDIACGALLMLVCWLPYLIASYPGVYWSDTTSQLVDYYDYTTPLSDHNPVFDTLLLGVFSQAGAMVSGNQIVGLYVLTALNMVFAVTVLAVAVCYLSQFGVSIAVKRILLAFFALFPFFPCFFSTLCKDTLFAPMLFVWVLLFVEVWRTRGRALCRFALPLVCVGVLCCLERKTGFAICAVSLIVMTCYLKGLRPKALCCGMIVVVYFSCSVAFPMLVESCRGMEPGGKQEIFAVPLQQVANVVRLDPEVVAEDEWGVIDRCYLMGADGISEAYTWNAADGVKQYQQPERADYGDFLLVWARLGIEKPGAYLAAWAGIEAGAFAPSYTIQPVTNSTNHREWVESLSGWSDYTLSESRLALLFSEFAVMPILSFAFLRCVWATAIPAFLVFCALRLPGRGRRVRLLVLLCPMLLVVASFLVGPTMTITESVRYVAPLVCLCPFYLVALSASVRFDYHSERQCPKLR